MISRGRKTQQAQLLLSCSHLVDGISFWQKTGAEKDGPTLSDSVVVGKIHFPADGESPATRSEVVRTYVDAAEASRLDRFVTV